MTVRPDNPGPDPPESRPLLSTRALVIILIGALALMATWHEPKIGIPILVFAAIVTLLVKIVSD